MTRKALNMVDPLGTTPIKSSDRIASVSRIAAPAQAPAVAERTVDTVAPSSLANSAKELAAKPPVDLERVARIRKAIADGNFPIYPATIADRLIASKYDWLRNDGK